MTLADHERLQTLLGGIEDIVLVHDRQGRILDCNAAACDKLGYSRSELLALRTADLETPPPELLSDAIQTQYEQALGVYETRHRRRDGECIPVDVRRSPVDYDGVAACVSVARDITHRKQIERDLRESEEKYRRLYEGSADGVFLLRQTIIDCNPAVCRMWGYSRSEIIGRRPEDFSPPTQPGGKSSAAAARQRIRSALAGTPLFFTWQHQHRDGRIIDTEIALTCVHYHGEQVLQATMRDVTERNRAQQRIEHLNAVLRAIRNVNQLIAREPNSAQLMQRACECLVETRGYHLAWIALFDEQHKLRSAGHAGRITDLAQLDELLAGPNLPCCVSQVLELSSGEVRAREEFDCEDCPLFDRESPGGVLSMRLEVAGNALGVLVVTTPPHLHHDVEEQALFAEVAGDIALAAHGLSHQARAVTAQRNLHAAESLLSSVLNSSTDAIIALNADGAKPDAPDGWRIVLGNHTAGELFDQHTAQLAGQPIEALLPEWDSLGIRQTCSAVHQTRQPVSLEVELQQVALPGWYHITVSALPRGVTLTLRNVTARVRAAEEKEHLEAQLRRAQKLEAVGQLAGGVAHDFNNILTAVLGNIELLRIGLEAAGNADEVQLGHLDQVERAAQRAASLTRQMLAFSRRQTVRQEILDLNHILAELEKMLRRLITENVLLELALSPGKMSIRADAGQLEQIVMNLAINARDAMPDGGHLTIETRRVELDDEYVAAHPGARPGPHVVVAVSDTGTGIEPAVQQRIFEPFYTTKLAGEGTGLGLSTVYGITKQLKGHLDVYSELGHGSTFKVYLPLANGDRETEAAQTVDTPRLTGTETVLVCEDDAIVRDLARRFLEAGGYTAHVASTGQRALEIAAGLPGPLHLLLTDVIMPGMDGKHLAQSLQRGHPETRVLFMSGYTANVIARHGVTDPGIRLLDKPFSRKSLLAAVREALDAHQPA